MTGYWEPGTGRKRHGSCYGIYESGKSSFPVALPTDIQISAVMDKFEQQFEDLDVQSSYMENAMGTTTATSTPQDEVDLLMSKIADEAGLEMNANLSAAEAPKKLGANEVEEDRLGERLRALRG